MSIYSKEIIKHFKDPKNMGKIKNVDGLGRAGNPLCGDIMEFSLKIGRNKKREEVIEDIKFETLGCAVAIANASLLTMIVKGKTIKEALKIKRRDLVKKLGQPLPLIKVHCSVLAIEALHKAIYDYQVKQVKQVKSK